MPLRSHCATRVTVVVLVPTRLDDLEVRHALLEQVGDLPAVGERLELGRGAEVAQEAEHLVAAAEGEHRVGEAAEGCGHLVERM